MALAALSIPPFLISAPVKPGNPVFRHSLFWMGNHDRQRDLWKISLIACHSFCIRRLCSHLFPARQSLPRSASREHSYVVPSLYAGLHRIQIVMDHKSYHYIIIKGFPIPRSRTPLPGRPSAPDKYMQMIPVKWFVYRIPPLLSLITRGSLAIVPKSWFLSFSTWVYFVPLTTMALIDNSKAISLSIWHIYCLLLFYLFYLKTTVSLYSIYHIFIKIHWKEIKINSIYFFNA